MFKETGCQTLLVQDSAAGRDPSLSTAHGSLKGLSMFNLANSTSFDQRELIPSHPSKKQVARNLRSKIFF